MPDQPEDWNSSPRTLRNDWAHGEVDKAFGFSHHTALEATKEHAAVLCGVVLFINFLSDVDHSILFHVSFSSARVASPPSPVAAILTQLQV